MLDLWSSGTFSMVLCAALFALSALCVKLLQGKVPILEIVAVRSICAAVLTALSIWRMRCKGSPVQYFGYRKNFWVLLGRGIFGAIGFTLYYSSIQILPLPDAVVIFFTNVVWCATLSVLLRYEKLTWQMAVGCTTCIVGVAVLVHPPFLFGGATQADASTRALGIALDVAAAFFASIAFIMIKQLGNEEEPIVMTIWFHAAAGIGAFIPLCFSYPDAPVLPNLPQTGLLVGVILTSFLGQLLISRGFQLLSASVAASLNLMQVVYANILGFFVMHTSLHWYNFAGAGCIIGGVLLTQEGRHAVQRADARRAAAARAEGEGSEKEALYEGGDEGEGEVTEALEAQGEEAPRHSRHAPWWWDPKVMFYGLAPPSVSANLHLLQRGAAHRRN